MGSGNKQQREDFKTRSSAVSQRPPVPTPPRVHTPQGATSASRDTTLHAHVANYLQEELSAEDHVYRLSGLQCRSTDEKMSVPSEARSEMQRGVLGLTLCASQQGSGTVSEDIRATLWNQDSQLSHIPHSVR